MKCYSIKVFRKQLHSFLVVCSDIHICHSLLHDKMRHKLFTCEKTILFSRERK